MTSSRKNSLPALLATRQLAERGAGRNHDESSAALGLADDDGARSDGGAGDRELILHFKDTVEKVVVPANVPLVRTVPGSRSDLVVGAYVFTVAQAADGGKLSAARIQVSKDGVKPPL